MGVADGRLAPHRGGNSKLDGGGTYHKLRSVEDRQIGWLLNNPQHAHTVGLMHLQQRASEGYKGIASNDYY